MLKKIQRLLIHSILSVIVAYLSLSNAQASTPLWTFEPLTAVSISVPINTVVRVQYRIKNQSNRTHTLALQPIHGVSQVTVGSDACAAPFVLPGQGTCTLSLEINGGQLTGPILGGPILCQQGSTLQCYRPSSADLLDIAPAPPITLITPSSGSVSGGTGVIIQGGSGSLGTTLPSFGKINAHAILKNANSNIAVLFDNSNATDVQVVSNSAVTAVTPAHPPGTVDVSISSLLGLIVFVDAYTYLEDAIGQPANGGVIACLEGGTQDLIAATSDNSTGIVWGGSGITTLAQSETDGATNTTAIVDVLGDNDGTAYAAQLCDNYEVDSQGNNPCQSGNACYDDWFLPAPAQLTCLYNNRAILGGFADTNYWSSTEYTEDSPDEALGLNFIFGIQVSGFSKNADYFVRCMSRFTPSS